MRLTSVIVLLFAMALPGCQTDAPQGFGIPSSSAAGEPTDLPAAYARLRKPGDTVYALDPQASVVRIYVFRGGRAARIGHNHVLSAPRFIGFVHLPAEGAAKARFDLGFRLDELEFDRPEQRATLGSAFASVLSPEAIAATREHMLSEDNMQAARFPSVRIRSAEIVGEAPKLAAKVLIALHGNEREFWLPLSLQDLPEGLAVYGALVLKQSDFGVRPYSALGGLLAVRDELVVEFRLLGRPVVY
jgi:hypothetical protein